NLFPGFGRGSLFREYSEPFSPLFESDSSSTGGLGGLDRDYVSDLYPFRLRSESPSPGPPLRTAFLHPSSTASKRIPPSTGPTLSASPTPVPPVSNSAISRKTVHPPPGMTATVGSSKDTAHTAPSEVHRTRRRSPEPEANDGRVMTDKPTKRQRSLPPPPPEHAAEDTLAWTLNTWLKNGFISPDRVIAEAKKFQLDTTVVGTRKADLTNASSAEAMQDIVYPAIPDSSEPASMTIGRQDSIVDLTDDMPNAPGTPISEQLTMMDDVRPGERMQ